jgi:predicted RNA-binding Zn ribbon-like protein
LVVAMPSNPAPGQLEVVRGFVNTLDLEEDREELDTPAAAAAWLAEHGLLQDDAAAVTAAQLDRARALREAIRAVLRAHRDGTTAPEAAAILDAEACRARLGVHFGPDGLARDEPAAEGFDAAIGRLLLAVAQAQRDGTWNRLKVCVADDCQYAFYDRSRNRSAVWCDMAVCGNREKVRAYRRREAAHQHS